MAVEAFPVSELLIKPTYVNFGAVTGRDGYCNLARKFPLLDYLNLPKSAGQMHSASQRPGFRGQGQLRLRRPGRDV